ncbi:hypothetical protein ACFWNN_38895 [Lentzea sp. NPDC058450]|uniref:hypothetical protein n=1 Tax=Lentzea sp. NPDC058450 TaxID=3346505 RepID=UPI003650044D
MDLEDGGRIPQHARQRFLRGLWEIIDQHGPGPTYVRGDAARERLEALGASPDDLRAYARLVAYEALHSALYFLDDPADDDPGPGWALIETSGGELTGRLVQGLYEDLDPDH